MNSKKAVTLLLLVLLAAFAVVPVRAQEPTPPPFNPDNWQTGFGGFEIGTLPGATDDYTGAGAAPDIWGGGAIGVFTCAYYQNGVASGDFPQWQGGTGFYLSDIRGPIAPGGSKTWSDIYLWDQSYALSTPGQISFPIESDWDSTPMGYTAHIVLDQVPTSVNWTGPTDFWVDIGQAAGQDVSITLPIATLTDPSQVLTQGTEMHITVYAPVPEPSSALPLFGGLIGMVGFALRRRKL